MRIGETESSLMSSRVVPSDAYGAEESPLETIAATIHQDLRPLRTPFPPLLHDAGQALGLDQPNESNKKGAGPSSPAPLEAI
jgi:hypothetical protein